MIPIIVQVTNKNESIANRNMQLINGEPQISFLLKRLKEQTGRQIIIATTNQEVDDELAKCGEALDILVQRGDFYDILSRLIEAADKIGCNDFVRVFGNYPLVDMYALQELENEHISGKYDYSYNEHRQGVLWGTGCDIFHVETLKKLNSEIKDCYQREAISFYLQQNTDKFRINRSFFCENRPQYKLNVETEKDLAVVQEIYNNVSDIKNSEIIDYISKHEIISKYNIENPAKEVGTEKLYLHTTKIQDILEKGVMASAYPISVELTLTNACNLKCVYCSDQDLRERQGYKNMAFETFERLFKDLSEGGTKGVVFEGGGEPTIHPDFSRLLMIAKKSGLAVGLITNGTSDIEENILEQFEWIRVSLDASNEEEYLDLKKVDCFERVLSNIGKYVKYCNTVGVGYVVTNKNMSNIETLILRLRDLGVSYIQMRPVVDNPELLPNEKDLKYLEFYRNGSFNVIVDGMEENINSGNGNLPCYASSITSIISGDGNVFLCGRLNIYDWLKPIGNIQKQNFNEIWYGTERQKQLKMISDKEFCKNNCPQCRVSKYNMLFNRLFQVHTVHFI